MKDASSRRAIPFEPSALEWSQYTKTYRDALYLYCPVPDRKRWFNRFPWNDLCTFSCGWYVEAHGHYWERCDLTESVYIYCTSGKGFYRYGGREWKIGPGELLYCAPLTEHSYGADPHDPWTIYWMHIAGPASEHYRDLLGFTLAAPVKRVGIRPRAIAAFRTLFHFMRPPLTDARMASISLSARFALACLAMEDGEEVTSESIGTGIQLVIDHMERHVTEAADLPAWLKLFGGSRSHFHRQFKRTTGHTPGEYFLRLKIRKACSLLATSNLLVKEIADRVGLQDPYYFSRLFRRVTGTTARAYREHIATQEGETVF